MRQFGLLDKLICISEAILTTPNIKHVATIRKTPGDNLQDITFSKHEKHHTAGLMRVNHSGEICAQALYLGQAITANLDCVKEKMQQSADEEIDHLNWCEQRLKELNANTSYLNPLWFYGSLIIGGFAGILGDKWSLGFVAETEIQVGKHLQKHLSLLSAKDLKSKAILEQMYSDETKHAKEAFAAGGVELPDIIKKTMSLVSKFMTTASYYI